jgi:aminopeptidase YwaD
MGSPAYHAAADDIEQCFCSAGFTTHRTPFDAPAWQLRSERFSLKGESLPALANPFTVPCDVEGRIVVAGTMDELRAASLRDALCVLCGDLTKEPFWNLANPIYMPEQQREVLMLLMGQRPAAVICVNLAAENTVPIIEDWMFDVPSLTVSAEVGTRLVNAAGESARVAIDSTIAPGMGQNIVASKASKGSARKLVLMAHYDTKPYTAGAIDNASGVATMLAAAERLSRADLRVNLECIAFGGEEYAADGTAYLKQYGLHSLHFGEQPARNDTALNEIVAAINIDGIGMAAGANTVAVMGGSPALEAMVDEVKASLAGIVKVDPWPASNHFEFVQHGVPSIPISSVCVGNVMHHPRDTRDWLSEAKLEEVAAFVAQLAERLQNQTPAWSRS